MTNSTTPTGFEDRLLAALRPIVADNPAPATAPATVAARGRRRLVVSGATLTAATAAAAVAIFATGGSTPPAYAVDSHADGTITVTIDSLSDAAGLQAKLRAAGVDAYVTYDANPTTCSAAPQLGMGVGVKRLSEHIRTSQSPDGPGQKSSTGHTGPGDAPPPLGGMVSTKVRADGAATFTIDPNAIPKNATLAIAASSGRMSSLGISIMQNADGSAPKSLPCVPAPPRDAP